MKRAVFVLLLALAVASPLAAGIRPTTVQVRLSCPLGLSDNAPAPTLILKKPIKEGTRGSVILYKQLYAHTVLPCGERHGGAIIDPGYLMGRVARRDIDPGEQLIRLNFSNPGTDRGVTNRAGCATGAEFAPVPVVIANRVIRKGTLGQVIYVKRLAQLQTFPCFWRRQGAIVDLEYLIGLAAKRDIFAGQQLTRSQFS